MANFIFFSEKYGDVFEIFPKNPLKSSHWGFFFFLVSQLAKFPPKTKS